MHGAAKSGSATSGSTGSRITVTVAARSQKQVALINQPSVKVESIVRLRTEVGDDRSRAARACAGHPQRPADGLGLPLPAGKLALFGRRNGRRMLIGEGRIDDHTIGEKVEISVGHRHRRARPPGAAVGTATPIWVA